VHATGCHSHTPPPHGVGCLVWQVVAITRPSRRRGAVVGVLKEEGVGGGGGGLLFLQPRDARLPRAVVQVGAGHELILAVSCAPVVLIAHNRKVSAGRPAVFGLVRWLLTNMHAPHALS
jgi:hypothetical protein